MLQSVSAVGLHGEAFVMLAGDHDIFMPASWRYEPIRGVEFHRVELRHEFGILGKWDLGSLSSSRRWRWNGRSRFAGEWE